MSRSKNTIDDNLFSWEKVAKRCHWDAILLGNGASRAIWDDFGYATLYAKAQSDTIDKPLTKEDVAIFDAMKTMNFELVMATLTATTTICGVLGIDCGILSERYESIRQALIQAVQAVHLPWSEAQKKPILKAIRDELCAYRSVYTTNYDLILYWAIMAEPKGEPFIDYFWSGYFNPTDTDVYQEATKTKVLYIHGALHLYRINSGQIVKRTATGTENLLDLFALPMEHGGIPLFISEGTSDDKLAAIHRSDYLAFAYKEFAAHSSPLVIFGHSLGDSDAHLLTAMRKWRRRPIAISVYPSTPEETVATKARIMRELPEADILFFDATTHPLGKSDLKITR